MERAAGKRSQQEHDHDIDERSGDGDDELFGRLVRHALEAGEAADGEQGNVRRANAIAPRGKGVAKFVAQHTDEDERDDGHAADGSGGAF